MQEHRWTGDDRLTGPADYDSVRRAIANEENAFVALHRPGSVVTMKDGKTYLVDKDGAWRRVPDAAAAEHRQRPQRRRPRRRP